LPSTYALGFALFRLHQRAQTHPWFTNRGPIYRARDPQRPADPPLPLFKALKSQMKISTATLKALVRINRDRT